MATTNHFDLIVLGPDLPGLIAAALAAKRGRRVVVLPQGPASGSVRLANLDFRLDDAPQIGLTGALGRRVFEELGLWAQMQRARRRVPGHMHYVLPQQRLDVGVHADLPTEATRAWPEGPIDAALERLDLATMRADEAVEELLSGDAVLSPEGFWARRFLNKATSKLRELTGDPLHPLEDGHPLRAMAGAALPWVQHLKPALLGQGVALRLVRRFVAAREDHVGGQADLRRQLLEVIRQKSGDYKPNIKVAELLVKRGKVAGVRLLGKDERYGCESLVVAGDPRQMIDAGLLPGGVPRPLQEALTGVRVFARRWICHLVVDDRGLSPAFDGCVLLVDGETPRASASQSGIPIDLEKGGVGNVYVRRRPHRDPEDDPGAPPRSLITITRITGPSPDFESLRAETLDLLHERGVLPFVHRHVQLCYSPHDGLGATTGYGEPTDRLGPDSQRSMPTTALFEAPSGSTLGAGLLPLNTGIKNLTFASRLTYPGLGLEGELLAGLAAAERVAPLTTARKGFFGAKSRAL